jgi:hypothetical protein
MLRSFLSPRGQKTTTIVSPKARHERIIKNNAKIIIAPERGGKTRTGIRFPSYAFLGGGNFLRGFSISAQNTAPLLVFDEFTHLNFDLKSI